MPAHPLAIWPVEKIFLERRRCTVWKIQNDVSVVLGGEISSTSIGKGWVNALALDQEGRLIVAGSFDKAGSTRVSQIALFDG